MTKTILLAVDTTSHTEAATDLVCELAKGTGDRVVVLHVHEFAVGRFGRIQVDCAENEGEHLVAKIAEKLTAAGVPADQEIRKTPVGRIARMIANLAEELDVRMIVLGSTNTHDLPRLPFGSVSLRLLHLAGKPVLIAPKTEVPAGAHIPVSVPATV
jgi:nucleotide-binding universal stress UspA family protein